MAATQREYEMKGQIAMDSKQLREHTAFLEEQFREDVKELCGQTEETIKAISVFISGLAEYSDLRTEESWMPVVNATGLSVDKVVKLIAPVHYIATVSAEEDCPIQEIVEALRKENLLPPGTDAEIFLRRVVDLGTPIRALRMKEEAILAPNVPLLHIKKLFYRTITVSEYDKEYNTKKDDILKYQPSVKRLYPRITLELEFHEDNQPIIGILLTDQAADVLIRKLQAARRQLAATSTVLPKDLLAKSSGAS